MDGGEVAFSGSGVASVGGRLELGDRVLAAADLGGFLWPKVRRGSPGIVIGYGPRGSVVVHFNGRCTVRAERSCVVGLDPPEFVTS